jgi:hypothetical protein
VSNKGSPHFVDVGMHDGAQKPPWDGARKDRETWTRAMAALERRPRFLWISLNDADEWGHRKSRDNYLAQLKRYDIWLDELVVKLGTMGAYGESTTIVCTTDHGRGDGVEWDGHGPSLPESRRVFAFSLGSGTAPIDPTAKGGDHRALRATIETLLGLTPSGVPLEALLPRAPIAQAENRSAAARASGSGSR